MSGPGGGLLTTAQLDAAVTYVRTRPAIREVILTGGDPLMLSPRRLGELLGALDAIPHLDALRIHTRVPTASPERVSPALLDVLATDKPLFIAVHANHAREFAPAAAGALRALSRAGAILLGQSVLLRGVNDNAEALEALFRAMLRHRIKPYYLHQLDAAPGTARFSRARGGGVGAAGEPARANDRPRDAGLCARAGGRGRESAGGKAKGPAPGPR